jgi:cytochrome c biogenesis protein CcmG/thiol:disulfide interchange protein DsbE
MKRVFILVIFLSTVLFASSQTDGKHLKTIPSVIIKTVEGENFNTSNITNDGKPIIISFWALWCKPCIKELTAISDVYDEWREETGVKLYAVSIDDSRSSSNVLPTVNGKGWEYEVLLDPNGDFKRAMNVGVIPHTFLVNGKGEIVWQHTSFVEGGEQQLIEKVRALTAGKPLE